MAWRGVQHCRLQDIAAKQAILLACDADASADAADAASLPSVRLLGSQPDEVVTCMFSVMIRSALVTPPRLQACLLPSLRTLDLSAVPYTPAFAPALSSLSAACPALETLVLRKSTAPDRVLARAVAGLSCLTSLSMAQCPKVGNATIRSLLLATSRLTHLDLRSCAAVDDEPFISTTPAVLRHLTSLDLSGTGIGTDCLRQLPAVSRLVLKGCRDVDMLPLCSTALTHLNLKGMSRVDSHEIAAFLRPCLRNLVVLKVPECGIVASDLDRVLECSGGGDDAPFPLLALDLSWCEELTEATICRLLARCPRLERVGLRRQVLSDVTAATLGAIPGRMLGRVRVGGGEARPLFSVDDKRSLVVHG